MSRCCFLLRMLIVLSATVSMLTVNAFGISSRQSTFAPSLHSFSSRSTLASNRLHMVESSLSTSPSSFDNTNGNTTAELHYTYTMDFGEEATDDHVDNEMKELVHALEKTNQMVNQATLVNALVIGGIALGSMYQLLHVHAEALWALYDYGLGAHSPEVTLLSVTEQTLAHLPVDLIKTYEALVPTNPIFFKACTSGVAYGLGDFISQIYQGKKLDEIDLPRAFRSGAAGFIAHGPLCHYWLLFMETYLDFDGAWWATGIKVTADLTVWSIFLNAAYSTIIGLLAFRSPVEVLKDVKATQWPALRSAWRFWPFVHTISFSHAVPLDLKLLWVDVMEVVWVTILSKVNNEDKAAKDAAMESMETMHLEHGMEASTMHMQVANDDEEADATTPSQPIPAWMVGPKNVLAACWPLIVMWPVLYGGYQLEHALGLVE